MPPPAATDPSSTALALPGSALALANRGFIQITTLKEAREFAEFLCKSELVPKGYRDKPADIVIAMQMGLELGVPPLQALQNISVINGRASVWGDLIPGIVLAQPDCEDFHEQKPEGEDPTKWAATCTIIRRGKTPFVYTFTWADAVRAGLATKDGPWKQYPKRQLQMRARGFCARDAYPDRLRGLITAEEALDYPSDDRPTPSEPRRVGEAATPAAQGQPSSPPAAASAGTTASTPPAAAAPVAPGAAAPASNGGLMARQAKILKTAYVGKTKDAEAFHEISTTQGVFVTQDEQLAKSAASCEDTDHLFSISYRKATRKNGAHVKVATAIDIDEDDQTAGAALPLGDEQ